MSTKGNFGGDVTPKGRRLVKKSDRKQAYRQSFGDLPEGVVYRDPLGFGTPGPAGSNRSNLQKEWSEKLHNTPVQWDRDIPGANESSIVEKWNELAQKGFSPDQTTEFIAKSLDTGDWQLPLDIIGDVFVRNPEQTPAAEFIPRVSTMDDTVHATPETDQPEPEFGLEAGASTNAEGDRVYAFDDPTYEDLSYDVLGYGVGTRISDQMILAARNLRSPEAAHEQALMTGHRQKTERQIMWGTDGTAPAEGDANGWTGFSQMGQVSSTETLADLQTPTDAKQSFEQAIDIVQENGAELGNIAVFCGYDLHRTVRRAFEDNERYRSAEDLDVGFATFAMEGGTVPVFKSNAIPRLSNYPSAETNDAAFVVNMDSVALYQLQSPTLQPLADLGPESRVAADQYNVLVSESGDGSTTDATHIQRIQVDTS